MRFHEALVGLLDKYGWKRSAFVRRMAAQGIHPTQVRRWLRGERTPKLDTDYRDQMAQVLGLGTDDRVRLRDAQVQSLQEKRGPPARHPPSEISQLLNTAQGRRGTLTTEPIPRPHPLRVGIPGAGPVRGRRALMEAAVALIEAAPAPSRPGHHEILITTLARDLLADFSGGNRNWLPAVLAALSKGYDVAHLLRLPSNPLRSLALVENMLSLLDFQGQYRPFYIPESRALGSSWETLIVPGIGALLAFSTERPGTIDAGLLIRDPREVEVLRSHFMGLRTRFSPLLEVVATGEGSLMAAQAIAVTPGKEGDEFACLQGLDSCTMPYAWLRAESPWARSLARLGIDSTSILPPYRRRIDCFHDQVERYRHWQIYRREAMMHFAREGEGLGYSYSRLLDPGHRMEQLENVVRLLRTYDSYQLALASEEEAQAYSLKGQWEVKWDVRGAPTVLLERRPQQAGGSRPPMALRIGEPVMCRAFRDYFLEAFGNGISPANRDKNEVVAFLQRQIDWLRSQMNHTWSR